MALPTESASLAGRGAQPYLQFPCPVIADELRRQADVFTDLVELQSKLGRDPSERPAFREPRHHAPQFLQRATTRAPPGEGADCDD
jgi:hypothetical protein